MRKCKACGLQFYAIANPTREICHCCTEALKRLNGYAVPVVRCKDCKYHVNDGVYAEHCRMHGIMIDADDFCSYGERREGE